MAMSLASSGNSIGQLIGIPAVALTLAAVGWRSTLFWVGTVFLVVALPLCWFVIRNRPEDIGVSAEESSRGGGGRSLPIVPLYDLPWVQCLHKAPFLLLASSFFTCGFTVTVMGQVADDADVTAFADAGVDRLIVVPWGSSRTALEDLQTFAARFIED